MKSFESIVASFFFSVFFANMEVHAWTINMDFNKGPLGATVEDKGNGYAVFSDAAGDTKYSNCDGFSLGSQCAKMSINKGCDGWSRWGGRIHLPEKGLPDLKSGDEVWVSVKLYMPLGFDYSVKPSLKFMRFHTTSPAKSNEGYNDLYITPDGATHWDPLLHQQTDAPFFFVKEQQNLLRFMGDFQKDKPMLGRWETYEMYLFMDPVPVDSGGRARARVWKNGKLLADLTDVKTLNTESSSSPSFLLFTYWNGGNPTCTGEYPTKSQSLYIDDLILTTDRPSARDEYGNAMIGNLVNGANTVGIKPAAPTLMSISTK